MILTFPACIYIYSFIKYKGQCSQSQVLISSSTIRMSRIDYSSRTECVLVEQNISFFGCDSRDEYKRWFDFFLYTVYECLKICNNVHDISHILLWECFVCYFSSSDVKLKLEFLSFIYFQKETETLLVIFINIRIFFINIYPSRF